MRSYVDKTDASRVIVDKVYLCYEIDGERLAWFIYIYINIYRSINKTNIDII